MDKQCVLFVLFIAILHVWAIEPLEPNQLESPVIVQEGIRFLPIVPEKLLQSLHRLPTLGPDPFIVNVILVETGGTLRIPCPLWNGTTTACRYLTTSQLPTRLRFTCPTLTQLSLFFADHGLCVQPDLAQTGSVHLRLNLDAPSTFPLITDLTFFIEPHNHPVQLVYDGLSQPEKDTYLVDATALTWGPFRVVDDDGQDEIIRLVLEASQPGQFEFFQSQDLDVLAQTSTQLTVEGSLPNINLGLHAITLTTVQPVRLLHVTLQVMDLPGQTHDSLSWSVFPRPSAASLLSCPSQIPQQGQWVCWMDLFDTTLSPVTNLDEGVSQSFLDSLHVQLRPSTMNQNRLDTCLVLTHMQLHHPQDPTRHYPWVGLHFTVQCQLTQGIVWTHVRYQQQPVRGSPQQSSFIPLTELRFQSTLQSTRPVVVQPITCLPNHIHQRPQPPILAITLPLTKLGLIVGAPDSFPLRVQVNHQPWIHTLTNQMITLSLPGWTTQPSQLRIETSSGDHYEFHLNQVTSMQSGHE